MKFKIIAGIGLIFVLALGGLYIRVLRADLASVKLERDTALKTATQCQEDQKLTSEVSDDYQTKIRALNRQLAALKQLRDNPSCLPVTGSASGHHAGTGTGEPSGKDGVRAEWLYDFAAEGEKYRLQLIGCQEFIKRTWERKGGN